jgi:hypothetical protein
MLTSGMVPALYADDEKEAILSGVSIYMSHIFTCYQHLVSWSFFLLIPLEKAAEPRVLTD